MKVLKFGGTSVGTPQRMKDVAQLINDGQQKIVVLSAMSGTTNSLVEISDYYRKRNSEAAGSVINKLIDELGTNEHTHECALVYCYIRRIREIRNILTNRAVKRHIYAYVES